ncbi:aminotransferase class V-fold PLP-dependent enzyme [Bradyrhizobium yuanmingense]
MTSHKLYGPTGVGVLYGKSEHWPRCRPPMATGR